MENVASKLLQNCDVSKFDLFRLVDINGLGFVDIATLKRFLSRTGISITDHKLQEILTDVKGDSLEPGATITLNASEFTKSLLYI